MKNKEDLEQKIIESVYKYEAKRTFWSVLKHIFLILFSFFVLIFSISSILVLLKEQQTLDLFELFQEDSEVVKTYFFDALSVFYEELPKFLSILTIFSLFLLTLVVFFLIKNFSKIKNRFFAIKKFFNHLKHFS